MSTPPDDSIDPDETARLTVHAGWPRDLLSWVTALPPLLYLGAVAAGFAGFTMFVILLLTTSQPIFAAIGGIATAAIAWCWWAREHFGVSGERVRFFANLVVADLRVDPKDKRRFERHAIPYGQIGTVSLVAGKSAIRVRFDLPSPGQRSAFVISLPRLSVRDQFDEIQQWIEASNPDHLFVAHSDEGPQYSRPWALSEVFPDYDTVEGDAYIDRFHTSGRIQLAGRDFEVSFDGYGFASVRILDPDNASSPLLAAVCKQTNASPSVRVSAAYGLQILECQLALTNDRTRLAFGWGPVLAIDMVDGVIAQDSDVVGHVVKRGEGAAIHLIRPMPAPAVLSVFLVLCYLSNLIPVRLGAALRSNSGVSH